MKQSDILYEDNHIIVVNKAAGILSQGDMRHIPSMYDMLKDYIKTKYAKPGNVFLGVVHRLDMNVSGILVYAKTSKAADRLHTAMVNGRFRKFYIAAAEPEQEIGPGWHKAEDNLLRIYGGSRTENSPGENTKPARLFYRKAADEGKISLLCISLDTGRKHQIRAQLAARKMPVIGDKKYGSARHMKAIMLHSVYLKFPHPVRNQEMEFMTEIPERFLSMFRENPVSSAQLKEIINGFRGTED